MATVPDPLRFEKAYEGNPPWDIGKPQPCFVKVADQISGAVLDSGCGTGDLSLFLARRGCRVTGIDFMPEPIRRARAKAESESSTATFIVKDVLTLSEWDKRFDTIVDSGVFHVFGDDDRKKYVQGLGHVLKPGGKLYFACFSDLEPGTHGPRRVSRLEIEQTFRSEWKVESITPTQFEIRPDFTDAVFSPGGARAWFVVVARQS